MQFQRYPGAGRLDQPIPLGRPERIEIIPYRLDRILSTITSHPCVVSHHTGRALS